MTAEASTRGIVPAGGTSAVELYWLPLGAGGHFVRLNGRAYEALMARMERRPVCALYHSALEVLVPDGRFVIEQTPVPDLNGKQRGVVAEGAVGSRWAARFRTFRYEVRVWRDGHIPDVAEAVDSPRRLTNAEDRARSVLNVVAQVPTPVWGRDELGTGDMWNSNSVIAWVLARSGIPIESIHPPAGGRAPGWQAGLVLACRHEQEGDAAQVSPTTTEPVNAHLIPALADVGGAAFSRCPNRVLLPPPSVPTLCSSPGTRSDGRARSFRS